jgi:hypothetical protein
MDLVCDVSVVYTYLFIYLFTYLLIYLLIYLFIYLFTFLDCFYENYGCYDVISTSDCTVYDDFPDACNSENNTVVGGIILLFNLIFILNSFVIFILFT